MSAQQTHFNSWLFPTPSTPTTLTPTVEFPNTRGLVSGSILAARFQSLGYDATWRYYFSFDFYAVLKAQNSFNTCGPVALDMIINQMPVAPGVFRPTISAQDTFLGLVLALIKGNYTEKYADVTSYSYDSSHILFPTAVQADRPRWDPGAPQGIAALEDVVKQFRSLQTTNLNPSEPDQQTFADSILHNLYQSEPMVALVFINIDNWHGAVVNTGIGHFVVVKGMTTESSANARWVEVLNPFNNRYEYYKWSDFYTSLGNEGYNVFAVSSPYIANFSPPR
jgi:hypothetical protein